MWAGRPKVTTAGDGASLPPPWRSPSEEGRRAAQRGRAAARRAERAAEEAQRAQGRAEAEAVRAAARQRARARVEAAEASWAADARVRRGHAERWPPDLREARAGQLQDELGLVLVAEPAGWDGAAEDRATSNRAAVPTAVPRPQGAQAALGIFRHNGVWVSRTALAAGRPGLPDPPRPRRATGDSTGTLV